MIWKRYQNELIVVIALLLMLTAYFYKQSQANKLDQTKQEVSASIDEIAEIIALKNQWGDPKLSTKIKKVKENIDEKDIKAFTIKNKKLTASFSDLDSKEMNKIIIKLENIAVQIIKLKVTSSEEKYNMEIKCKW